MLYDNKAEQNKAGTSDASTSVYESAAQSRTEDAQPPQIAAPSYAEAAASAVGVAAQPEPSATASNAQAAAAPEDSVIAQAPIQQQAARAGASFGPDLEHQHSTRSTPFLHHHNGQVEALGSYNRRAFNRFIVAFAWAVLAWFGMLMVAGGATELMVHDVRQAIIELWRAGMLMADM